MSNPALSLILCSRNDQYMGNSRWRLQTTLNYVAQMVQELGRDDDVEALVPDWGLANYSFKKLSYSPGRKEAKAAAFQQPQFTWLYFILMMAPVGV